MYFHDLETEKYQSSSNTYQRDKNTHIALKSPLSDYLVMWAGKIYDSKTVRWFFLFWVSTFLQLALPINLSTTETRTDENVHVFRNIEDRAPKIHIIIKCNSIRKNNYTLQRFSRWKAWQKENSAFIPPPPPVATCMCLNLKVLRGLVNGILLKLHVLSNARKQQAKTKN